MKHTVIFILLINFTTILITACTGARNEFLPIHNHAQAGNIQGIKNELAKGISINSRNHKGETPLHFAASSKQLDTIKYLVENGADVNAMTEYAKATPLLDSIIANDIEAIKYLVESGSRLDLLRASGGPPHDLVESISLKKYLLAAYNKQTGQNIVLSTEDPHKKETSKQTVQLSKKQNQQVPASQTDGSAASNKLKNCAAMIAKKKACDQIGGFGGMACMAMIPGGHNCF